MDDQRYGIGYDIEPLDGSAIFVASGAVHEGGD